MLMIKGETAMSDEADIANDSMELNRLAAIEACRHQPGLPPKGSCWFCDEPVGPTQKFCDRNCAEDYELEEAALMRAGRRRNVDLHAE
jgi:predicted nucleic acid-binding Zn ribbon protein